MYHLPCKQKSCWQGKAPGCAALIGPSGGEWSYPLPASPSPDSAGVPIPRPSLEMAIKSQNQPAAGRTPETHTSGIAFYSPVFFLAATGFYF